MSYVPIERNSIIKTERYPLVRTLIRNSSNYLKNKWRAYVKEIFDCVPESQKFEFVEFIFTYKRECGGRRRGCWWFDGRRLSGRPVPRFPSQPSRRQFVQSTVLLGLFAEVDVLVDAAACLPAEVACVVVLPDPQLRVLVRLAPQHARHGSLVSGLVLVGSVALPPGGANAGASRGLPARASSRGPVCVRPRRRPAALPSPGCERLRALLPLHGEGAVRAPPRPRARKAQLACMSNRRSREG